MYQKIFSNMFMIGFYLYFFNKFCANYLKTHFGKSIISIIYLTILYKIISVDYIIKNLIIISFIGLISYENDYINKKIGYFDNNEKIKKIQEYVINIYDKISVCLNYVFVFYDIIISYFKNDYIKLSGNISEFDNTDSEEMEIMLNKMKEMINDINIDNIKKKSDNKKKVKYDILDVFNNDKSRIDDDIIENKNINNNTDMDNLLNNIISEIQPLLNKESLSNNDFMLNKDCLFNNDLIKNITKKINEIEIFNINKEIIYDKDKYDYNEKYYDKENFDDKEKYGDKEIIDDQEKYYDDDQEKYYDDDQEKYYNENINNDQETTDNQDKYDDQEKFEDYVN